jgi:predicted enzyme related to lactoylglutathione lyase
MALTNHRFCWHGIISTDLDQTTPFYAAVLPWTVEVVEMGGDPMTFFQAVDGQGRAHTRPPQVDGEPAYWSSYFRVEDVDAAAAAAVEHGGTLLVPPTDIAPGRFATVLSPSGAAFNLFHEANAADEARPDVDGAVHWNELHSTDLEADLAWLRAAFGLTTEEMAMPNGPYTILKSGEAMVGGAMTQAHEGAPSMWLPWVHTEEVDGAVEAAPGAGGAVVAPTWDVPNVGRMAILADPAGAVFGVIKPAERA